MDFHAHQGDSTTHVMTTHRAEDDTTALHLVSAKKVAYWQTLERDYFDLIEKQAGAELHR